MKWAGSVPTFTCSLIDAFKSSNQLTQHIRNNLNVFKLILCLRPESKRKFPTQKSREKLDEEQEEENTGAIVCVCGIGKVGPVCARRSVVWERRHDEPLTHKLGKLPVYSIHPLIPSHMHVTYTHEYKPFLRSLYLLLNSRDLFLFSLFVRRKKKDNNYYTTQSAQQLFF